MKSKLKAIDAAINLMRQNDGREYFVVYFVDEFDIPGNNYHVASEFDLDTFYLGSEVLYSTLEDY